MSRRIIDLAFQDVGKLDRERIELSRAAATTLSVHADSPAREVAQTARSRRAGLILVVDEGENVRGVVAPAWVLHRVGERLGVRPATLLDAVDCLERDPEFPKRGYRHEWLNFEIPTLFWCDSGKHFVDALPCEAH